MTPEDLKRLQELEDLLDEYGDELSEMDEDDRDELKELRSMAREEKKRAKTLAKFDKARTVFRVVDPDEGDFYMLDLATAQKWAGTRYSVEEVDRKTLTCKFTNVTMSGLIGDSDDFGYVEVYVADEDEAQP